MRKRTRFLLGALVLTLLASCQQQSDPATSETAEPATPESSTGSVDTRLEALEKMIQAMERNPNAQIPAPFLALSAAQVYGTLAKHERTEKSGDLKRLLASDNPRERASGVRVQNQLQAERQIFEKLTAQLVKLVDEGEGAEELREMAKLTEVRRALKAMPPELAAFAE